MAVVSYGFWQDHYGGANSAIGSTLSLNDHPFQVIGVAPSGFLGMDVGEKFDVAVPICASVVFDGKESRLDHRSWWWLSVAARVKPGIKQPQVTARLKTLSPGIFAASVPQIGGLTNQIMITSAEVAARTKWNPIKITGGVFADEAIKLLRK